MSLAHTGSSSWVDPHSWELILACRAGRGEDTLCCGCCQGTGAVSVQAES